ncbi:AMP-binding protein [Oceanicoccus sp. KOV_DT_Chl]|uniref:ApeI family dehydratase n=1 Tax=Oceanicoccus sp. KOV_DT_Chl TaxID=1904639 RepID=UPI0011AEC419|nr:AMP-binding protein [Oceanicoccus sp. KOV_DT_Chl]
MSSISLKLLSLVPNVAASTRSIMVTSAGAVTGRQFAAAVAGCYSQLMESDARVVAIYTDCAYLFSVALFSALHAHKEVVILPNVQTGFLQKIADEFDLLIIDQSSSSEFKGVPQLLLEHSELNPVDKTLLPAIPDDAGLTFFTSGSTGQPSKILKKIQQITDEVAVLESVWSLSTGTGGLYASVSHQHLYGFLFKLMWPLAVGKLIHTTQYHYPEPLMAALASESEAVLVSSPALLNRIGRLVDLSALMGSVQTIFSSGGPLDSVAAMEIAALSGVAVQEIFGSTETGGVAYRSQSSAAKTFSPWTLLPTVNMKVDTDSQCLLIESPHADGDDFFAMGDVVELINENQFILKHRADRIVKIEEKRLSLPEMEAVLKAHAYVKDCSCAALAAARRIIVSVVKLSALGEDALASGGRHSVNQALRAHLLVYFEAILLPKKWRYVESIPVNSQGKVTADAITALFSPASSSTTRPDVAAVEQQQNEVKLDLKINPSLRYFDGHFDDKPILPGVVQVDWAINYGRQYFTVGGEFMRLEVIKFHEFIEPGDQIELSIIHQQEKGKLVFQYSSSKGIHSSGRIVFG